MKYNVYSFTIEYLDASLIYIVSEDMTKMYRKRSFDKSFESIEVVDGRYDAGGYKLSLPSINDCEYLRTIETEEELFLELL